MNKNIEIRFTKETDLDQLPWLYRQYHNDDTKIETNVDGMIEKYRQLSKTPDYRFISAMHGAKLVGFCSVVINHDIVEQQKPIIMY